LRQKHHDRRTIYRYAVRGSALRIYPSTSVRRQCSAGIVGLSESYAARSAKDTQHRGRRHRFTACSRRVRDGCCSSCEPIHARLKLFARRGFSLTPRAEFRIHLRIVQRFSELAQCPTTSAVQKRTVVLQLTARWRRPLSWNCDTYSSREDCSSARVGVRGGHFAAAHTARLNLDGGRGDFMERFRSFRFYQR